jgi:hypothetical protein
VDGGIHVACDSLKELLVSDGDALDAFGGRDGDAVRVPRADYLTRRLRTSIRTHVRGDVAIEATSVGRPRCRRGSGRERGGEDDAGGGGLGLTTQFVLERTDCRVSLLLSGVGRMQTLEVILCASSVVTSSSKSAAPATTPVNDGVRSVAASATREELVRAEQRIWGDDPGALHMEIRLRIPPISESSPSRVSGSTRRRTGLPPMVLVPSSRRQWTMADQF